MQQFLLTILLALLCVSRADAIDLRLKSGPEQGSYYQIGQELSKVTEPSGVHLQILPSQGSWENIVALYNSDTEFAIFQLDAFVKAAKNLYINTSTNIKDDIRVVMPLYNEEIHVIKALGSAVDFSSQTNFVVGCGAENSESCLSAAVIEELYDKEFRYVTEDYVTALSKLKGGSIDLVIITAGKPTPLLLEQTGIEPVSMPRVGGATDFYSWTTLRETDYPWVKNEVETFAVRSVLATMIQQEKGLASDMVGSVHFSAQVNAKRLKNEGHPKWQDVDFGAYNENFSHLGAMQSLIACKTIMGFGYDCADIVFKD